MGEYERLREYHNECCKEWEKERAKWIEKYNSLSRDLHSGKFCNTEGCNLIKTLKEQNETYKKMLDNPEVHVALTDVRTGERDLWQKYKPRMEQAEQKLKQIEEVAKRMNNECFYDDFDCEYCDMKNGCTYLSKSKIIQIIEEEI